MPHGFKKKSPLTLLISIDSEEGKVVAMVPLQLKVFTVALVLLALHGRAEAGIIYYGAYAPHISSNYYPCAR